MRIAEAALKPFVQVASLVGPSFGAWEVVHASRAEGRGVAPASRGQEGSRLRGGLQLHRHGGSVRLGPGGRAGSPTIRVASPIDVENSSDFHWLGTHLTKFIAKKPRN